MESDILRFKAKEFAANPLRDPVIINGIVVYALKFENNQIWSVRYGWLG